MHNDTVTDKFDQEFYEKGILLLIDKGFEQFHVSIVDIKGSQEKKAKTLLWIASLIIGIKVQLLIYINEKQSALQNISDFNWTTITTFIISITSFLMCTSSLKGRNKVSIAFGEPYKMVSRLHTLCTQKEKIQFYYDMLSQIEHSNACCNASISSSGIRLRSSASLIMLDMVLFPMCFLVFIFSHEFAKCIPYIFFVLAITFVYVMYENLYEVECNVRETTPSSPTANIPRTDGCEG